MAQRAGEAVSDRSALARFRGFPNAWEAMFLSAWELVFLEEQEHHDFLEEMIDLCESLKAHRDAPYAWAISTRALPARGVPNRFLNYLLAIWKLQEEQGGEAPLRIDVLVELEGRGVRKSAAGRGLSKLAKLGALSFEGRRPRDRIRLAPSEEWGMVGLHRVSKARDARR